MALAAVGVVESVALISKVYVPAEVGVPERTPDVNVRPVGKAPLNNTKVYGPVPPLAANV